MKSRLLLLLLAGVPALGLGQTTSVPILTTSVTRTVSIQLGQLVIDETIHPPTAPVVVATGAHVLFTIPPSLIKNPTVKWYHGTTLLAAKGASLNFAAATAADAGDYYAIASPSDGSAGGFSTTAVSLAVSDLLPHLVNVSTRAMIDANRTAVISGFVTRSDAGQSFVLVRAIGPTLRSYGVAHPLAAPHVTVYDSTGHVCIPVDPPATGAIVLSQGPTVGNSTARVGAFPLPDGTKDVAYVYQLSPGAYTAHVTSGDGTSGEALVEIYEVPY